MEPFVGGQYTDGPDWRFIHMAELSGFFILFAFIWKHYFNNFPNQACPLMASRRLCAVDHRSGRRAC